jgi:hypothetical protein
LISASGLFLLKNIDREASEFNELLNNLSEKEALALNDLLNKIRT